MGMNWLITGGCGFIGANLVQRLWREQSHAIRIVDNLSTGSRDRLGSVCEFDEIDPQKVNHFPAENTKTELIIGDIRDAALAENISAGADVIVHLAANADVPGSVEDPVYDCHCNVLGTLHYLEAARKHKIHKFVFASSAAPTGECEPPVHEEMPAHPMSPYGAGKLAGEGYCSAYYHSYGPETIMLRFGNVYGPLSDHKTSVVAKFIRQGIQGETIEIYGDGNQTRDFIYMDDLIKAIIAGATVPKVGGEVFQIASNSEITIKELAGKLFVLFDRFGIPKPKIVFSDPRPGDIYRNFSDTSKARKILDWKPDVAIEEGLLNTLKWFFQMQSS